ncbi:hypothetical protein L6164_027086 [Bauhinia variegata]|uniref:Uncharacterized protein n=1 Tax=Bauhinia variegata TaxID=167791 RepID=A0ACB9LSF5_BAUVA|nr:hypothetical protein L6164_027086 [Bauhinia variegata]
MIRNRDLSLFLPFFFGLSIASPRRDGQDQDQESGSTETSQRGRIILINPLTQGMVVIDGTSSLEALFSELGSNKGGQPPASKDSIDDMPSVEIGEDEDGECVICLEEWEAGNVAKKMPCEHKFHPNCIEKWLGIHGSCLVCRYQMPVDEKDVDKNRDEEGGERRRGEVWVSFSFNPSRRSEDSNPAPSADSTVSPSSPRADSEVES